MYHENCRRGAQREVRHFSWNVLGIYAAAGYYGVDGIDRFIGHFPACIAYAGDEEDGDGFVRLYKDVVSSLPEAHREFAAQIALNVIRHAQKCVTDESAFMGGVAQRPVLSFGDIDYDRAVADARAMANRPPVIPYIMDCKVDIVPTRANDIHEGVCNRIVLSQSAYHRCLAASWGNKTEAFELAMEPLKSLERDGIIGPGCRYEWRVLQGDEKKVRIVPQVEDAH